MSILNGCKKSITIIAATAVLFTVSSCKSQFIGTAIEREEESIFSPEEPDTDPLPEYAPVLPPDHLTASEAEMDMITLSWNHIGNAATYNIYRADSADGSYTRIVSDFFNTPDIATKRISFSDNGSEMALITSFKYFYRVTSVNAEGIESGYSESATGFCYLTDAGIQPPITIIASEGDYTDKITIQWNEVGGASAYKVFRGTSEEGPFEDFTSTPRINATPSNAAKGILAIFEDREALKEGVNYFYQIQSENSAGESSILSKTVVGFLADPSLPSNIVNLKASQGTDQNQISLTWDRVSGISKYAIYRCSEENGLYTKINEIIVPSGNPVYVDTDSKVIDERSHFYKVKCFDATGRYGAISTVFAEGYVTKAPPVLTLLGNNPMIIDLTAGDNYQDPSCRAVDNVDGDLSWSVFADDSTLKLDTRGEYQVVYSVTDRSGLSSTISRTVKVVSLIDDTLADFTRSIKYPTENESVSYRLDGLTADARGGDIRYRWIINAAAPIETATSKALTRSLPAADYTLVVEAYNDDDSVTRIMDYGVYPDCSLGNGDFETGSNAAPWLWDVDWYWNVPSTLGPAGEGWDRNSMTESSNSYTATSSFLGRSNNEKITDIVPAAGRNGSRAAVICNTESYNQATGVADFQQTAGRLATPSLNVVPGPVYELSAWFYRGPAASTQVSLRVISPVDLNPDPAIVETMISQSIPDQKGVWHQLTLTFQVTEASTFRIELFKGASWSQSDRGEVRFDDITLKYKN